MTNFFKTTRKTLTSEETKKRLKALKGYAVGVGNYSERVSNNIDQTFSIPRRYPDGTISNLNRSNVYVPSGFKLVKKKKRR